MSQAARSEVILSTETICTGDCHISWKGQPTSTPQEEDVPSNQYACFRRDACVRYNTNQARLTTFVYYSRFILRCVLVAGVGELRPCQSHSLPVPRILPRPGKQARLRVGRSPTTSSWAWAQVNVGEDEGGTPLTRLLCSSLIVEGRRSLPACPVNHLSDWWCHDNRRCSDSRLDGRLTSAYDSSAPHAHTYVRT